MDGRSISAEFVGSAEREHGREDPRPCEPRAWRTLRVGWRQSLLCSQGVRGRGGPNRDVVPQGPRPPRADRHDAHCHHRKLRHASIPREALLRARPGLPSFASWLATFRAGAAYRLAHLLGDRAAAPRRACVRCHDACRMGCPVGGCSHPRSLPAAGCAATCRAAAYGPCDAAGRAAAARAAARAARAPGLRAVAHGRTSRARSRSRSRAGDGRGRRSRGSQEGGASAGGLC